MSRIVLASGSASRRAMLTAAGVLFESVSPGVDEDAAKASLRADGRSPRDLADALAELKALKVSARMPDALVIGSDSLVALDDGATLDKPESRDQAGEHLRRMSGRVHDLVSAAVIAEGGRPVWRIVDRARMHVRSLSDAFIETYLDAEWPAIAGCVGCYRIEGPGAQLFARIEGSHFTVLGLPLLPVLDYLRLQGGDAVVIASPYAEVIGDPITHSKSPLIHRFWLAALGLDADYRATHVTPDQLPAYLAGRRDDPTWRGCNVTIPHKLAVLDHVGDPGGVRASIGAANCVFRGDGGAWMATNTDAAGFYAPIAELDLADVPVAVIGSGGAARAVLFALARMGVGPVTILARNPLKAIALLATFGLKGDAVTLDAPLPPDAGLLVNASSLGMIGQPPLTLDLAPLPEDAVVYDLVYAPVETALLAAARARGLSAVDGLDMLIGQAAAAFELFFSAAPPRERDDELRTLLLA